MKNLFFALLLTPFFMAAQANLPQISQALNSGNAAALGTYFDSSVELSILDQEGIYNKAQAQQQVSQFFGQHKANAFAEVHQGASRSSDSQYVIGNLTTNNGTFRVYLYLNNDNGKLMIQEIRFDRE